MDDQIINPKFCGDCPYSTKTNISQVFLECRLWKGLVKAEYPACQFILATRKDPAKSVGELGNKPN